MRSLSRINRFYPNAESEARIAQVQRIHPNKRDDDISSFSPYIHVPEENLISILNQGFIPRTKARGKERDISPIWNQSGSAVYGEVLPDPENRAIQMMNRGEGASRYGELNRTNSEYRTTSNPVALKLRPSTLERSTVTAGDSIINSISGGIDASPQNVREMYLRTKASDPNQFLEFQYWSDNGLDPTNIESVIFRKNAPSEQTLSRFQQSSYQPRLTYPERYFNQEGQYLTRWNEL